MDASNLVTLIVTAVVSSLISTSALGALIAGLWKYVIKPRIEAGNIERLNEIEARQSEILMRLKKEGASIDTSADLGVSNRTVISMLDKVLNRTQASLDQIVINTTATVAGSTAMETNINAISVSMPELNAQAKQILLEINDHDEATKALLATLKNSMALMVVQADEQGKFNLRLDYFLRRAYMPDSDTLQTNAAVKPPALPAADNEATPESLDNIFPLQHDQPEPTPPTIPNAA